nr:DoxX family protein [uncultured Draconibacterium sp.]
MKTLKITYWTSTIILSLLFLMNIFMYFTRDPKIVAGIDALGYPLYLLDILGVAKIIGIIILLVPKFPRLKEWAYAGFVIDLIGAIWSHIAIGDTSSVSFILMFVMILAVSYVTMRKLESHFSFQK